MRAAIQRVWPEGVLIILLSSGYLYILLQQHIDLIVVGGCYCLLFLRWELGYFITLRRLIQGERHRQALFTGVQTAPVVGLEPASHQRDLSLPCTLRARPGFWLYLTFAFGALGGLIGIDWGLFDGIFGRSLGFLVLIAFWAALLVSVGYALNILLAQVQRLDVSEEGMAVQHFFRRQTIRWQDARLLTIDPLCRADECLDRYELTSATTILRWRQPRHPSRFIVYSASFQDYSRQIETVLSLIANRTGLPLHDLRMQCSTSGPASQVSPEPR
jgi:hypothetical protein